MTAARRSRNRFAAGALVLVLSSASVCACAIAFGLDDHAGAGADDGGADGAASDADDTHDAAAQDAPDVDACVGACQRSADEECDRALAANPLDAGYRCVSAPPGWTVVAYAATADAGCGEGYTGARPLTALDDAGPDTCACTCSMTNPGSCVAPGAFVKLTYFGSDTTCADASATPIAVSPNPDGGSCLSYVGTIPSGNYRVDMAPTPPTCQGVPSKTAVPPPGTRAVATCDALSTPADCSQGRCYPGPPPSQSFCLVSADAGAACPIGFGDRHVLGTGSGVDDLRGCGPCSCRATTGTCVNGRWDWSTLDGCSTQGTVSQTCTSQGGPYTVRSYDWTGTVTGSACGSPTTSSPTGGVQPHEPVVVCYRP